MSWGSVFTCRRSGPNIYRLPPNTLRSIPRSMNHWWLALVNRVSADAGCKWLLLIWITQYLSRAKEKHLNTSCSLFTLINKFIAPVIPTIDESRRVHPFIRLITAFLIRSSFHFRSHDLIRTRYTLITILTLFVYNYWWINLQCHWPHGIKLITLTSNYSQPYRSQSMLDYGDVSHLVWWRHEGERVGSNQWTWHRHAC